MEIVESEHAKASPVLYPTPGFTQFCALPKSPVRGLWAQDNRAWAVAGDSLYELTVDGSFVVRPQTSVADPAKPTVKISDPIAPLSQLNTPVIYPNGTAGSTTYGYKVTATNVLGETLASNEGFTAAGNAVLSAVNYNLVTWNLLPTATGYKVYRTTGGSVPPRLIATVTSPTQSVFSDFGDAGTAATPPTSNTTGSPAPSATWGYKIVATNLTGTTLPSPEGTVLGYPKPSAQHYNTITWTAIPNCTGYQVYRTTAPQIDPPLINGVPDPTVPVVPANTLVLIGTIVGSDTTTFKDDGIRPALNAPTPVLPVANTTLASGLAGGSSLVSITSSGDAGREMFICAGGTGYIYDLDTNSLTAVVNAVSQGGFIDGYFVALDGGTSTFKMSNYLDGLVWDATQIAQRNSASDKWRSMLVVNREIWLFGEQTSDVWVNLGSAPFPFGPNPNVFIEVGSGALWSPVRVGQELIWLGQDQRGHGMVFRPRGYTPERVSTHAQETELQQLTFLADAEAWGYQQDGHAFYVLTFPSANKTYVFDLQTNRWANRGVWNTLTGSFDAYRARCHCLAFGGVRPAVHLVGDRLTGLVYTMRLDVGNEIGGGVIRRMRRAPHLHNERVDIAYRRLEVDLEVGLGLNGATVGSPPVQGEDPTIMLRWSDDGSKTWSNEHWTSAGRMGTYRTRVRWSRLGAARDRVFELVCTDPVPWRVIDATIGVEPGQW